MPYSFKRLTIYLLDIHPAINLVEESGDDCLQDAFAFLRNREEYEKQYAAGQPLRTANFLFRPLSGMELEKRGWWKSFSAVRRKDGGPDVWNLQLPFVGQYTGAPLTVNHPLQDVTITVSPTIWLRSIGWSAQLKLNVRGEIKKADLIELTGWLRGARNDRFSFGGINAADGKACLRHFYGLLLSEVYRKENPPHSGIEIVYHCVTSIAGYEGDYKSYLEMPDDEKALMRGIVYGYPVPVDKLEDEEQSRALLRSQISKSFNNFALTDFEVGTLIFLQRLAQIVKPNDRRKRRRAHCFTENCKNCIATAYLISRFRAESEDPGDNSDMARLRADLEQTLKGIPRKYRNVFCKNLFANHKDLK